MYDPLSHLVYVTRGDDVQTVVVNGKILMQDRKVLTLNERAVLAEANAMGGKGTAGGRAEVNRVQIGSTVEVQSARFTSIHGNTAYDRTDSGAHRRDGRARSSATIPAGEGIHLVGVLKGGFMFMADLVRAMSPRVTMDFIAVSSYGKSTKSSGEVRMLKDLDASLEGRHVIIVEDIVDTGLTLTYLQDILRARAPKSLKTACLLSKPSRRKVDVTVDYIGFTIEDGSSSATASTTPRSIATSRHIAVLDGGMKRFDIITETDARVLDIGSTVELAPAGS